MHHSKSNLNATNYPPAPKAIICVLLSPQAHLHLNFIILIDHMLVSVCLPDINFNVSTKPEKLGSSLDTTIFKYIS